MPDAYMLHVKLKPNCGLENTRASLVMRRIEPLCDRLESYPPNVKGDQRSIRYLRDNGFFLRFEAKSPELVIATAKTSFFVEECSLVDNDTVVPAYEAEDADAAREPSPLMSAIEVLDVQEDLDTRENELLLLLSRLDGAARSLRSLRTEQPDRRLDEAIYDLAHVSEGLRNSVERDRMGSLDRIIAPLRLLVDEQARRYGVEVRFSVSESRLSLDRAVLAMLEETVRRVVRACIRCIEGPEERRREGKPEEASIRLEVEGDGAQVVCRVSHDGKPFETRRYLERAAACGLLARPLDSYTDEEAGRMALMPRFVAETASCAPLERDQGLSEIATLLQRFDAQGEIRNTPQGAVEVLLRFPVLFTAFDAMLFTISGKSLAIHARHIVRFEAFDVGRIEQSSSCSGTYVYRSDEGEAYPLANGTDAPTLFAADDPVIVMLMQENDERRALAVDSVSGYERILVRKLPPLIGGSTVVRAGCMGYATLPNGTVYAAINARDLPVARDVRKGARHAR